MSGGITWLPYSWGNKYRILAPKLGGISNWDSAIWSQVPRNSHLRKTALARPSKNCKLQIHHLVREGTPYWEKKMQLSNIHGRKRKTGHRSQVMAWHRDRLIDWPSVVIKLTLTLFERIFSHNCTVESVEVWSSGSDNQSLRPPLEGQLQKSEDPSVCSGAIKME
jgi:hypothetical protein